jgi:hypothetical protein
MARSDARGGDATAGEPQVVVGTELAGYRIESLLGRAGWGWFIARVISRSTEMSR